MSEIPRVIPTPPTPPIRPVRPAREVNRDRERPRKEPAREEGEDEDPPAGSTPDDESRGGSIDIKV